MVDVVVNHNGYSGRAADVNYSVFNPFNEKSYYHPYCAIDFDDMSNKVSNAVPEIEQSEARTSGAAQSLILGQTNLEKCWFAGEEVSLPDLRTEDPRVASGYQTWIQELVSNYSIDGLRLDTVIYVNKGFWSGFEREAGVWMVGEVFNDDPSYDCSYQNYVPGVMNFGT